MRILIFFLLIVFAQDVAAKDSFEQVAASQIQELIRNELWNHYDMEQISIQESKDHAAEWGGPKNGYGIKTVVANFVAIRNDKWHKNLNRKSLEANCNNTSVWLLCRPKGYRFEGKVEVDIVATTSGWKILSRNFRNRSEFVLSNYLLLVP
jgi:hypothetical protein